MCAEQRTLPHLSLTQVIHPSPSHGSGQGAHSSGLAHVKHTLTGRRGKGGVAGRHFGVTKASSDRTDTVLPPTWLRWRWPSRDSLGDHKSRGRGLPSTRPGEMGRGPWGPEPGGSSLPDPWHPWVQGRTWSLPSTCLERWKVPPRPLPAAGGRSSSLYQLPAQQRFNHSLKACIPFTFKSSYLK